MKRIADWIIRKFLLKYLKGALDKLPANGKKTVVTGLVAAIGAVLFYFPEADVGGVLSELMSYMKAMGIDKALMEGGMFAAGISFFHKILKWIDGRVGGEE